MAFSVFLFVQIFSLFETIPSFLDHTETVLVLLFLVEVGWDEEKDWEFSESGESKLDPYAVVLLCCNVNKNGNWLPKKKSKKCFRYSCGSFSPSPTRCHYNVALLTDRLHLRKENVGNSSVAIIYLYLSWYQCIYHLFYSYIQCTSANKKAFKYETCFSLLFFNLCAWLAVLTM